MTSDAAQLEYESRLSTCRAAEARHDLWHRRLGNARVVVGGVGLALAWPTAISQVWSPIWLLVPALVFAALAGVHAGVLGARRRMGLAAAFYRRGLDRLAGEWGDPLDHGAGYVDEQHPYTADLDLFGRESLYALLCTAHGLAGRDTLARWLATAAEPEEVRARQVAAAELAGRLDLREQIAVLAADLSPQIDATAVEGWARAPAPLSGIAVPVTAVVLALVNSAATIAWLAGPLSGRQILPLLAVGALFAWACRARVRSALAGLNLPAGELRFYARLLERLEGEKFASPRLRQLQRFSADPGKRPSERLLRLARLVEWNDSRRNLFFQPLAVLLLLGTQFACAAERWRSRYGRQVGPWLCAIGEFEALCCLASFSFENPDYVEPVIEPGPGRFEGEALAHPLLSRDARVANDVALGGDEGDGPRLLLVSGSNMSGKSTLLRTVGVAAVLAQAGAVVPARRLHLSPLTIGASIRLHDSLRQGVSRFYAELQRLRQIRDLAGNGPTLFLLDEILHGTNSHDRRLGAAGLAQGLLATGAIGLVTTHDLALAEIADQLAPAAANVHFEDHLEAGRMAFDYRLRPGVVERGNALALMRSLGLPVAGE